MQAISSRMQKEIKMLQSEPPPGVWAGPKKDSLTQLEAQIQGPMDTVYEGGVFKLEVNIPTRYPFEPPKVRFATPIYHPNIDREGRICLDILNMPPKGAWKPSLNISTVLASVGLLLSDPNPDDGLVAEITREFKHQRQMFDAKARQLTKRHAVQSSTAEESTVHAADDPMNSKQCAAQQPCGDPPSQQEGRLAGNDPGAATAPQLPQGGGAPVEGYPARRTENKDLNMAQCISKSAAQTGPAPQKRPRLTLRK